MTYLVAGLVALLFASLYWREWSVSRERERANGFREERDEAVRLVKAYHESVLDYQKAVTQAGSDFAAQKARVEVVERENAQLRLELQKYETGPKKLGRLGRIS